MEDKKLVKGVEKEAINGKGERFNKNACGRNRADGGGA